MKFAIDQSWCFQYLYFNCYIAKQSYKLFFFLRQIIFLFWFLESRSGQLSFFETSHWKSFSRKKMPLWPNTSRKYNYHSCELNRSTWKQRLLSSSSVVFCQFWDTFEYLLLFRLAYPYRAKTRQSREKTRQGREKKCWGPFRSFLNTGYLWEKLEGGGIVLSDKYGDPSNTLQMIFEKLS